MRTTDEYSLFIQDLIYEHKTDDKNSEEFSINTNDIYKDLRACGYDYGLFFKRLKTMTTKDFKTFSGTVEWDGNCVTFLDGLLQTMAIAMPFRKLMVPVMIKRFTCDPKVLYEAVDKNKVEDKEEDDKWDELENKKMEEWDEPTNDVSDLLHTDNFQYLDRMISDKFHIFKSELPIHVDLNSRMVVTNGIEIEGLMALPIPRKSNIQDLRLESYQFLANEDMNAIHLNDRNRLLEYLKVCLKSN